ncbi:hypothetical protein DBR41_30225 [Pseudomonas sp. HMWF010]|nr:MULTISPECIES: ABC-three component system middle component 2 [unclassified Caulobacter]PTS90500.1 hypothetical protein DBR21_03675 [Caulobacter sp. HMWF009]PTT08623.1 hypothetical protein DBR10_09130 [Caulobacter sp. HMWF025]PTT71702.1 hypothetical protein DBR41_30225 [Pseudomonas sp. HMWF010]
MLFVLEAAAGATTDLQRLVSYDYLLVHSADVASGPPSLHPAVPFRGTELLVKRRLIEAGLDQMFSRELLDKAFASSGIVYRRTSNTTAFTGLLTSKYAAALRERAHWLMGRFGGMADIELTAFMASNIGRWGADFERFSTIDDLELLA